MSAHLHHRTSPQLPEYPLEDCAVTDEFDPVCGTDGVTYSNPSEATCRSVRTIVGALLLRLPDVYRRPLCFASVLFCQPDSGLRDGPAALRQKYRPISGGVLDIARKMKK